MTHYEDEAMFQNFDYPNIAENEEANEVISVRLLNSHLPKPILPNSVDIQNITYESIHEEQTESRTEEIQQDQFKPNTLETFLETTTQIQHTNDDSLEEDWVRSQIEIPLSSEEEELHNDSKRSTPPPASFTTLTSLKTTPTTAEVPLRFPTLPTSTLRSPIVFGHRRRKPRNYDYYDELPDIDFDQIDMVDLEESDSNGKRLKEMISHGFESESLEQPLRQRKRFSKQQHLKNAKCRCPSERREQRTVIDDYDTQPVEQGQLAPLRKRFINQQNQLPTDDFPDHNFSMEQAERVQGALERIMGIVTIMSHVDSFIHKKTKQSIRRLAKLYESGEE